MLPWGHVLSMQELGQQRAELLGQGDAVRANHQEMEKKTTLNLFSASLFELTVMEEIIW